MRGAGARALTDFSSLLIPKDQLKDAKPWSPGALSARGPDGDRRAANESPAPAAGRRASDPPAPAVSDSERAEQERAARRAAADARVALELKTARQAAFDAGYGEGKALVEAHLARLVQLSAEAQAAIAQLETDTAEQLLMLAFDIARQTIRTELRVNRESMLPMVQEVLRGVPEGSSNGELLLNPDDVELIRSQLDEELRLGSWRVVGDRAIEPGGCRLVTRTCDIDATLPARWRRVMHSLARDESWSERSDRAEKREEAQSR